MFDWYLLATHKIAVPCRCSLVEELDALELDALSGREFLQIGRRDEAGNLDVLVSQGI